MKIKLPPVLAIDTTINGATYKQVSSPAFVGDFRLVSLESASGSGYLLHISDGHEPVLVLTDSTRATDDKSHVIHLKDFPLDDTAETIDLASAKWLKHPDLPESPPSFDQYARIARDVRTSWAGVFTYKREDTGTGTLGLRPPQLGALHAAQSHLAIYRRPATIVMPTGTGKTETMLSILIAEQCRCLLVIVPTDALRTQIAKKFVELGILKEFGIIRRRARYPVVGILKKRPKTAKAVDDLFPNCNVVIATMASVGQSPDFVQKRIAKHCTHLFIDEAHHMGAQTWKRFRAAFKQVPVLQFTATPYRNDEKPIPGAILFNYSLRQAQTDGYFKAIEFKAVQEFDPQREDLAIAEAAVEQLRHDFDKGHVLMARVNTIHRAREVFEIYRKFKEFYPVQIHTGIKSQKERDNIRRSILSGQARIVVCVDMLGEGFDLPELKIAAFHDVKKSLPITLQLAGRFTRSKPNLGRATFVANIANIEVKDELRKLYQRDVDWNLLLPRLSENAISDEIELLKFIEGFQKFPDDLSLQNVRPNLSAVAYRTNCRAWKPENFSTGIGDFASFERVYHDLNPRENTLVVVIARRIPVDWAKMNEIYFLEWQLYILFWDKENQLLFINNSSNSGFFEKLAQSVAGEVQLISGPNVFRCLSKVNRLLFQNVGLLEQLGRLIRYTMRAGSDVESGLSEAQKQKAIKSNLFGTGYEDGNRTSIGCSYKGRIWSRQHTDLRSWTRWCRSVGSKLLDESLDPEDILKGILVQEVVSERPMVMPIRVDWPDVIYRDSERNLSLRLSGEVVFLHEADISIDDPSETGPIKVVVSSENVKVVLALHLFEASGVKSFRFDKLTQVESYVNYHGRKIAL